MQLITTLIQGATDAFIQSSINTGLSASGNQGYTIDEIQFEVTSPSGLAAYNVELALSRASKATMPTLADDDVLHKFKKQVSLTTSGAVLFDNIVSYKPEGKILIIEETLYAMLDTNATGQVNTAIMKIIVSPVKVTTDERIAILQSRLN